MKQYRFEGTIEAGRGGGAFVTLPFNVREEFSAKGQVKVKASFDGEKYRGSLAPMGGSHILGIRKEIRTAIGKDIGDKVRVVVVRDTAERVVNVPPELTKAMRRVKGAKATFDALSYTKRREYAEMVASAKKEETRARRIEKILEALSGT